MNNFLNNLTPKKKKIVQVFVFILAIAVFAVMLAGGVNAPVGFNE